MSSHLPQNLNSKMNIKQKLMSDGIDGALETNNRVDNY